MQETRLAEAAQDPAHESASGFWWRALSHLGIEVRAGETRVVSALQLYCFLLGAFQFASKSVRQSTFVDSLGFMNLPWVYLLVAVCAYPLLRLYSQATISTAFTKVVASSTAIVAASLVAFWWLLGMDDPWIRFVFYIWISIASIMMATQFWTYANQALDPRQARRLFAYILSGGLIGGVLGGQIARLSSELLDTRSTLLVNVLLVLGTIATIPVIQAYIRGRTRDAAERPEFAGLKDSGGAFRLIRESKHLRSIAILLFLSILTAQIVDLQFNAAIEQQTDQLDQRTVLFGNLYSLMGLAAFFFQILVTSHLYRRLGIGVALRVLPTYLAIAFVALLFAAALPATFFFVAVASTKIGENAVRYSLDQGTRELLFVPVSSKIRALVKSYIDVLVQRFAKSAAAILLLTVTLGWISLEQTSWFALVIIALWIAQTVSARKHYVSAFREGLLSREIDPEEGLDLSDVTTLEATMRALGSADGNEVLHGLELLEVQGRASLVPPVLLRHDDPAVRLATLRLLVSERRTHAGHLIEELLSDPASEVRAEAAPALALLSGTDEPQLMLQRLRDPDLRVRASAIGSLLQQGEPDLKERAETELANMLGDADPDTRAAAARALGALDTDEHGHRLLQLLYDADIEVVRVALLSVRERVAGGGNSILFAPVLVSLLRERKLKHEAREALVASGEGVIPLLTHFMNDAEEQQWVRRALPKTIARFGSPSALEALTSSLDTQDLVLRHKIIQSLGSLQAEHPELRLDRDFIHRQIREQAELYLRALSRLAGLSDPSDLILHGIRLEWRRGERPSLLQQLLIDRMRDHLLNMIGLIALVYRTHAVWTSYEQLQADSPVRRAHALEYLDNSIGPSIRQPVLAVLDDLPIERRLDEAHRLFSIEAAGRIETLRALISQAPAKDAMALWIGIAALEVVQRESIESLYPLLRETARDRRRPLLQETALWALRDPDAA